MADHGRKIRCRKCKRAYYNLNNVRMTCPYCAKDALIPNGTIAVLNLMIKPGGYSNKKLCLEEGLGTQAKSGVIYLRALVTAISGPQKNKKFSLPIEISSQKNDYWQYKGRELIRGMLNSSQGLSSSDNSRKAVFGRMIHSYSVLNGLCFVGAVGIRKNQNGREENNILRVLSADDEEYKSLVADKKFIPARKTPPPSEPNLAMWRHI